MALKSALITATVLLAATLPVSVPAMSGTPVGVAVGPVEVTYDRTNDLEFNLHTTCFSDPCPIFELVVGLPGEGGYRIGL
jgi:hypothetical protein